MNKLKKILKAIIIVFILVMFIPSNATNANTEFVQEFDEENIVLTFGAISDVHIGFAGNAEITKNAYNYLKELTNNNLDAVVISGDLTQDGTAEQANQFITDYKEIFPLDKVQNILCLGNHDTYWSGCMNTAGFAEVFGEDVYANDLDKEVIDLGHRHIQVNGFDFLVIEVNKYGNNSYTAATKAWVNSKMTEITTANPLKPVYVVTHAPAEDTTAGSENTENGRWGTEDLNTMLSGFPQAIVLSGHLHYPENNERSIMQTDFTQVAIGAVTQLTTEPGFIDNAGGAVPNDRTYSQGMLVEVDVNGNTKITRYDFVQKKQIKGEWIIPAPKEDNSHLIPYSKEYRVANNTAPVFAADDTVKVEATSTTSVDISFNIASDDDMVYAYRIDVYNSSNELIKTAKTFAEWRDYPDLSLLPDIQTVTFTGTRFAKPYTVKVTAIDCWGVESEPLVCEILDTTEEDKKAAAAVDLLIEDLSDNYLTLREEIKSVRVEYDKLNGEQKAFMTKMNVLLEKEALLDNIYATETEINSKVNKSDDFGTNNEMYTEVNNSKFGTTIKYNGSVSNAIVNLKDTYSLDGLNLTFANLVNNGTNQLNFCILFSKSENPTYGVGQSLLLWFNLSSGVLKVYPHDGGTIVIDSNLLKYSMIGQTRFNVNLSKTENGAYQVTVDTVNGSISGIINTSNLFTVNGFEENQDNLHISFSAWDTNQSYQFDLQSIYYGQNSTDEYIVDAYLEAEQMNKVIQALPTIENVKMDDYEQVYLAKLAYGLVSEDAKQYIENADIIERLLLKIEELNNPIIDNNDTINPEPSESGCNKGSLIIFVTFALAGLVFVLYRRR